MRLHGLGRADGIAQPTLGRITTVPIPEPGLRARSVALVRAGPAAFTDGFDGYAAVMHAAGAPGVTQDRAPALVLPSELEYLDDGDIVLMRPSGHINVLYRRRSTQNTILVTERCNSFCVMCSQPPRDVDDSARVQYILQMTELIDPSTREIGLSGGEPTLAGDGFLEILRAFRDRLPQTALHVLTNGRSFQHPSNSRAVAEVGHPDLMLGIPLYADNPGDHDHVVQAKGAFSETLKGLHNLGHVGVPIEIRVVLHAHTVWRLPQLAEFVYRNLPFVQQVALMGLEPFGFAARNFDALWVDPVDYQEQLSTATLALAMRGMKVSLYNHQLCTLPRELWPFARKSISDWKNIYLDACRSCGVRECCTGFFHSATKRHSRGIKPQATVSPVTAAALGIYCGARAIDGVDVETQAL